MDNNDDDSLANGMIALGVLTFIVLQFVNSPFGKHTSMGSMSFGPLLPARTCWFVMECPNLIHIVLRLSDSLSLYSYRPANFTLLMMFGIHYFNRSIIYPLRMNRNAKPMPLAVMLCALLFCSINGYLQVCSLCYSNRFPEGYCYGIRFLFGVCIFIYGFFTNLQSDAILRGLKKQNEDEYRIPKGGMFEFVSCANFLGEIIEWAGFCIACNSRASFAFWFYTCCNLIPRAVSHHRWYKAHFKDYPVERKAVFPYMV